MSGVERDVELDALLEAAAADLAADGRPRAGDDMLIARSVDEAIARATAGGGRGLRGRRRWAVRAVPLVAAVLVATSAALALIERARSVRQTEVRTQSAEPASGPSLARPPAVPAAVAKAPDSAGAEVPAEPSTHPTPAPDVELTAPELFALANETRRHGEPAAAVRQYLALQRRFPRSPEASLSLVALGRLYLDRLGDPGRALAQFDEYVAGRDGELREEALVGRALALQRLGRVADEKDAWRALLAAFPNSLSANRAAARLVELH